MSTGRLMCAATLFACLVMPLPAAAEPVTARHRLTLPEAVQQALQHNLQLRGAEHTLAADATRSAEARGALRPQLELGLEGRRINADLAEASNGRAPQDRTSAQLWLEQSLYSSERRARVRIEDALQAAREQAQEALALDIIEQTSRGYLEVLRARSQVSIHEQEANLNRSNLEQAESRLELGSGNRAEVYRWETALARSESALNRARADFEARRLELNQLMNRPLRSNYRLDDPSLEDPWLLVSDPAVVDFLEQPDKRPRLRAWYLQEAADHAPELIRARRQIEAERQQLQVARAAFTRPEFTFNAAADYELSRHGKGTDELFIEGWQPVPGMDPINIGGRTDDLEWTLAVRARLPLYQGGRRSARVDDRRARLDALLLEQDRVMQQLEKQVLRHSYRSEASYDNIRHAREAARAGAANLELVQEAYAQGVMTVIDLVDAQSAALTAELEAANALYDFLIDYLALQRTVGRFDLTLGDGERSAARERLLAN